MELFYDPEIDIGNGVLPEEESRHCIKVLRKRKGDIIHITNGKGSLYTAIIIQPDKKKCGIEVTKVVKEYGKMPYHTHIAICPTKSTKRFEWFLEKATEVGVDVITPVICNNSERRSLNLERSHKVLSVAMKQSLKAYLPVINQVVGFKDFIAEVSTGPNDQRFIAKYHPSQNYLSEKYKKGGNTMVLIGPEGDFDEHEVAAAKEAGFEMVNLSTSRLRTETAGLVACAIIGLANEAG